MKRAAEFTIFVGLAVGAHLAVASYAPGREGAQSAGNEGAAAVSLQAASATVTAMVEQWETPPETPDAPAMPAAPQTSAPAPRTPQAVTDSAPFTQAPQAPGLALPEPESLPDPSATASPPPPPEPPKPEAEVKEDTAELAETRPAARPKATPQPEKQAARSNSRSSAPQKASGQGGGADAGARQEQRAATLSASQRQSLTAQWGAQVRRKIERGKRYPGGARGASGTVRVRITVGRDGSLRGVSLAGSSGHRALDEAALRAVRAARHFPNAPRGLSKPTYTFTLPMRFSG